mmetsp:Transcript_12732/g.21949  ORF Transcript_12732/g.21949 Transcript_12732/m.21949 type:complete len:201 (-) Transcript_12732:310-912(-)
MVLTQLLTPGDLGVKLRRSTLCSALGEDAKRGRGPGPRRCRSRSSSMLGAGPLMRQRLRRPSMSTKLTVSGPNGPSTCTGHMGIAFPGKSGESTGKFCRNVSMRICTFLRGSEAACSFFLVAFRFSSCSNSSSLRLRSSFSCLDFKSSKRRFRTISSSLSVTPRMSRPKVSAIVSIESRRLRPPFSRLERCPPAAFTTSA